MIRIKVTRFYIKMMHMYTSHITVHIITYYNNYSVLRKLN